MPATLRCTAKLLKAMRVKPAAGDEVGSNMLGDWTANLMRISHRQFVIAVSELTRLALVIDAAPYARVPATLAEALIEHLIWLGVPAELAATEADHLADARIAATNNRSVLGTLNQFAWEAECDWRDERATTARSLTIRLANTIVLSPRNIGRPADRVREVFGLPAQPPTRR